MLERPAKPVDTWLLAIYLSLVIIGWFMLYTVDYQSNTSTSLYDFLLTTSVGKQTLWVGISLLILFFTQIIDRKFWQVFSYPLYILGLLMLVLVLIFGKEIKGATSWFALGPLSIQPSEFAKFFTCLAIAAYLTGVSLNIKNLYYQLIAIGLALLPASLILLQPDAGSALVFLSFLVVFYRVGFPSYYYVIFFGVAGFLVLGIIYEHIPFQLLWWIILAGIGLLILQFKNKIAGLLIFLALSIMGYFSMGNEWENLTRIGGITIALFIGASAYLWFNKKDRQAAFISVSTSVGAMISLAGGLFYDFLKPHQQDRINVWLNPEKCDPQGSLYNLIQSKIAIASGGFQGQGFLNGNMTQLNFIPEQSTDFIFCTIGEEQGFLGTFFIIALYSFLLYRIIILAERQRSKFVTYYAYGLAGIFFFHFFVNIGMTMGLMPIIGIPLPMISKGGSALVAFTLMIGVLIKMDRHRAET